MNKTLKTQLKSLLKNANAESAVAAKIMTDCENMMKNNQKLTDDELLNHAKSELGTYAIKPSDRPELFALYMTAIQDQLGITPQIHADTGYLAAKIDRIDWQILVQVVDNL